MNNYASKHRIAGDTLTGALPLLAIDDDAMQRGLIKRSAEQCGYVVTRAKSYRVGVEKLGSEPFTCVPLDLNLEDGDGIRVLHAMAALKYCGAIFIISGLDASIRSKARESAANVGVPVVQSFPKLIDLAALRVAFVQLRCQMAALPIVQAWGEAAGLVVERSRHET